MATVKADSPGAKKVQGAPQIRTNLGRFASGMVSAIYATAVEEAAEIQTEMRQNAPWANRTGRSRENLFAEVKVSDPTSPGFFGTASRQAEYKAAVTQIGNAKGVTIYLYGTTRGNYFLEIITFPYKGYLGIIRPTAQKHARTIIRRLQAKTKALGL